MVTLSRKADVQPRPPRHGLTALLHSRAVHLTAIGWLGINAVVLAVAGDALPFDWSTAATQTPVGHLLDANLALAEVVLLTVLTYWLTRKRTLPNLADRAPERSVAARETLLLLLYGAGGLGLGFILARLAGWHPFGLHLAGSIYGTHEHVSPAESIAWATYNLLVYAVVPLLFFRRRYSAEALNLRSSNRRADSLLIGAILLIESLVQIAVLAPGIFDLTTGQLVLGASLTFTLYLAGAVLPAMIFIYAILVPRFLRLTGSTATTVILGGLTYTALHIWDAWTVFTTPSNAALSVAFLLLTYFAPGMFKTVLTVRTGNAWVHVWAYHALAPHTLIDAPHMVHVFRLK
ncbi:hypothetical protein GCM10022225_68520 [Plantactinospora mayteni]|uniref:Uncharacterized protein n=1 Tax=Plantactinospora mayteni TaxID=566021 RepID=A0ABQ4F151_9ACTN|nr:hypothetical protein [Plantactinospora mayteni]GIH00565.1 hypothetical protein Pma05_71370 [Plantactinospora mayteni]